MSKLIDLTGLKKFLDKILNEILFGKGTGKNSVVQKEGNNQAITEGSIAFGQSTFAGLKGWYYEYIDFTNKKIYLSDVQGYKTSGTERPNFQSGYENNDVLSIINSAKYYNASKITSVAGNVITVDSFPFTKVNNVDEPGNDDYSVACISKPTVGGIEIGLNSFSTGYNSLALYSYSSSEGRETKAYGHYSHAEGRETEAAYSSHAEGRATKATADYSHAEGNNSIASGKYSHAEGRKTEASGEDSHAEGMETGSSGKHSHSEGYLTKASNLGSHAEGNSLAAIGEYSHAEGQGLGVKLKLTKNSSSSTNRVYNVENDVTVTAVDNFINCGVVGKPGIYVDSTTIEGSKLKRIIFSNTIGNLSSEEVFIYSGASGNYSHAEGRKTTAIGNQSHTEGFKTIASADSSHAEGNETRAGGFVSHAEGLSTKTLNKSEHAEGSFNVSNKNEDSAATYGDSKNTQHSIGIGIDEAGRKNAFEVMQNGDAYIYNLLGSGASGNYDGTNATTEGTKSIQKVIQDLFLQAVSFDSTLGKATFTFNSDKYIFDVTKVSAPSKPTMSIIEGTCTTASTSKTFDVTLPTSGSELWYKCWENSSQEPNEFTKASQAKITVNSGFTANNVKTKTSATFNVKLKARKFNVESEVNSYTLTIKRSLVAPTIGAWSGDSYSKYTSCDIKPGVETGATQEYSIDGGTNWNTLSETITYRNPSSGDTQNIVNIAAGQIKVRTTCSDPIYDTVSATSSATSFGTQILYYGTVDGNKTESDIKYLLSTGIPDNFTIVRESTLNNKKVTFTRPSGSTSFIPVIITRTNKTVEYTPDGSLRVSYNAVDFDSKPTWATESVAFYYGTSVTESSTTGTINEN